MACTFFLRASHTLNGDANSVVYIAGAPVMLLLNDQSDATTGKQRAGLGV